MIVEHQANLDPGVSFTIGRYDEAVPTIYRAGTESEVAEQGDRDRRRREYDAARHRALRRSEREEPPTENDTSGPGTAESIFKEREPLRNVSGDRNYHNN